MENECHAWTINDDNGLLYSLVFTINNPNRVCNLLPNWMKRMQMRAHASRSVAGCLDTVRQIYHVNHTVICENGSDLLAIHAKTIRQCRKTHFPPVLFGLYIYLRTERWRVATNGTRYTNNKLSFICDRTKKLFVLHEIPIDHFIGIFVENAKLYCKSDSDREMCRKTHRTEARKKSIYFYQQKNNISFICLDHEYRGSRLAWIFTAHTLCWHLANSSGFLMFTWLRLLHLLHVFPSQLLQSLTDMHCRFSPASETEANNQTDW